MYSLDKRDYCYNLSRPHPIIQELREKTRVNQEEVILPLCCLGTQL